MTKQQTLRSLIELSGCVTQKAFAEKHGVIYQTVGKWLSGQRNISNGTLSDIATKEGYKLSIEFKLEKL